jgi:hypothetical protein
MPADTSSSDEKFCQPCSDLSEGKEGEWQRGRGLFIGVG